MTESTTPISPALQGLLSEAAALAQASPSWLKKLREAALAQHAAMGIPTTKQEDWKYTSLRSISESALVPASGGATAADLEPHLFEGECVLLTLVNGHFVPELSKNLDAVPGLRVQSLMSAIESSPELIETHLGRYADNEKHTFAALNTALFAGGAFIHVSKGTQVELPIQVLHLVTPGAAGLSAAFPRTLFLAERESKAFLIESYASIGEGASFVAPVFEGHVEANAMIEHVKLQRESEQATHIATTQVRQEGDSTYLTFNVTYGGKLTRNDLGVFLAGSNVHCRMDGIVAVDGEQHVDNHTRLDHAFPHCDSFEVYKHVLDDRSSAVFNGQIYVHQDAQKTDAKQTNQAILLSGQATMNSKPQLEIFADDVKCTHGATVGQLQQDQLFYIRSRGIPESQARALLVYAFAAEVLEKISNDTVRNRLEELLFQKLSTDVG